MGFPQSDKEVSIGAGVYGVKNDSQNAKKFLDAFIEKNIPAAEYDTIITGCVPLSLSPRNLTKRNILVVGDAARQANPLTAGGIMNTLEAADLAVKCLLKSNRKYVTVNVLKNYSTTWRRTQRRQQKIFYLLKEIFLNSSDGEIEKSINRMKPDFVKHIDRSKPFSFPVIGLIRIFFLFFRKIVRYLPALLE